ncbi:MAG: hypothetical protein Q9201_005158 [Fulgogasparrea decipioides]
MLIFDLSQASTLTATRDSSDGSSVSDKYSFRTTIRPYDDSISYTPEAASGPLSSAAPTPLSNPPPPFTPHYFPPEHSIDYIEQSTVESDSCPPPPFAPALQTESREETTSELEAATKAAFARDTKSGSSSKSAEEKEPPPPYTEGSSPLGSFTYVMAAAGGPASIITQVPQGGPPLPPGGHSFADVGPDENINLELRGTKFTLSREELLTLPEFVLLSLFPNGLLPDGHMNSFHEGDTYPVDYDPTSLQYMLDFFRTVAQTIPSASPSPVTDTPSTETNIPGSARDMLQDRAGIIVLREDLDFYAIPPKSEIDQSEMIEVKRAAGRALLKQDGIFSGLRKSEEQGTTEQHLIEMLTAGWGHRASEPNKAVICSLALARLRTDIKGNELANSNAVGMAQKLLLFWRKPARRCWWEGVELDNVEGIEGKLKVWIRRVWTLEMYGFRHRGRHVSGPVTNLRTCFGGRASLVLGFPSKGGIYLVENVGLVEMEFLALDYFHEALPSTNPSEVCQRIRAVGAQWFEDETEADKQPPPRVKDGKLVGRMELWLSWPESGGVWVLEVEKLKGARRGIGGRIKNAKDMEERCKVIEMTGGVPFEGRKDCEITRDMVF